MKTWYHPNWCGDFRLEAEGEKFCRLIVSDPTPAEQDQLGVFLTKARKKKWISSMEGVGDKGESTLVIAAPIAQAGLLLLDRGQKKGLRKGILTCVRSESGKITAVAGDGAELDQALAKPEAAAAVTNRRPTVCCPSPVPGPEIRASEVLRAFSTQRQWEDWMKRGYLIAYGNLTGHPYRIAHRHSPLAVQQGKSGWDLHDDNVVHAHDWSLPPAEEALSLKLCLEHAEHWIRNHSGYWTGPAPHFNDPFVGQDGQYGDGIIDAAIVTALGQFGNTLVRIGKEIGLKA